MSGYFEVQAYTKVKTYHMVCYLWLLAEVDRILAWKQDWADNDQLIWVYTGIRCDLMVNIPLFLDIFQIINLSIFYKCICKNS